MNTKIINDDFDQKTTYLWQCCSNESFAYHYVLAVSLERNKHPEMGDQIVLSVAYAEDILDWETIVDDKGLDAIDWNPMMTNRDVTYEDFLSYEHDGTPLKNYDPKILYGLGMGVTIRHLIQEGL